MTRNGTQIELDKAGEDATQIPFDALYESKWGHTKNTIVQRIKDCKDPIGLVAMMNDKGDWDYLEARDLEVI